MSLVSTLGCEVEHVTRIRFLAIQPIRDVLPKSASDLRIKPDDVIFAERFQTHLGPLPHRDHHGVLIHFEIWRFIELQTSLPCVSESIRPFTRMTILLMPDEFLGP